MKIDTSKFKYYFDDKTEIVFKYYFGKITIDDIKQSWDYAFENNIIPLQYSGFILDYRNANFIFDISEHAEIPKYYQQHPTFFYGYKIAIITENPKDIVVPVLVREKDHGYESKPFSTVEAAVRWIIETH